MQEMPVPRARPRRGTTASSARVPHRLVRDIAQTDLDMNDGLPSAARRERTAASAHAGQRRRGGTSPVGDMNAKETGRAGDQDLHRFSQTFRRVALSYTRPARIGEPRPRRRVRMELQMTKRLQAVRRAVVSGSAASTLSLAALSAAVAGPGRPRGHRRMPARFAASPRIEWHVDCCHGIERRRTFFSCQERPVSLPAATRKRNHGIHC